MESRSGPLRKKSSFTVPAHDDGPMTKIRVVAPSTSSGPSVRTPPSRSSDGPARTTDDAPPGSSAGSSAGSGQQQQQQQQQQPPPSRRGRKGFTVHWPFQSIATDTLSVFTAPGPELFRRATWQPPKPDAGEKDSTAGSPRDSTLIPDYVVNFIRGETPESVARRKRNGGKHGERAVDITHVHRPQRSHMAVMMAASGDDDYDGRSARPYTAATGTSTTTELRQILPDEGRAPGGWGRLATGWRSGVLLSLLLVFVIFITGLVGLVLAGNNVGLFVSAMDIYTGSCSSATHINWGLHALVNVAAVVLLVGANYAFQVLSSPKRSELSGVHESMKWLEIGVPSVRNFRHIGRGRALVATALLAVAVVTQIISNSLIFLTATGMDYNLIAVQPSFVTGAQFSNDDSNNNAGLSSDELLNLQDLASNNKLTNLTTPACVNVFTASFNADYSDVLLILADSSSDDSSDNSLVATARAGIGASPSSNLTSTTSGSQILVDGSSVSYCLARADTAAGGSTCTVNLDGPLFAATLGLNLLTLLLTAVTLLLPHFAPLVTLGDAVASFLRDPDPSTRNNALVTRENLHSGLGGWGFAEGKYWSPARTPRWLSAPSRAQWAAVGFWWLAAIGFAAAALALVLATPGSGLSPFGTATASGTYLADASAPSAALAVAASTPHLLLGGLYLAANGLLTAFFLSRESSLYAAAGGPRPLRVSADPAGHQTTSLYLTLPRPVSWALAVWFAAMGFVLSQAVFAVGIASSSSGNVIHGVGFSAVALLVLLAMLAVLLVAVAALGFRRLPPALMADGRATGNPLALEGGSCSAVISARCHRVPEETDVWMNKVWWGVVAEIGDNAVRHCTYSARPVGELDSSHRYV